jgi:hypothetical protein
MSNVSFPTEVIDLPSKGKFYPAGHPLASGQVELKYMTAKEEDILTSQNLIQKGIVLDKLIDSLIVTKGVTHEDFLIGDLNAVMVAARILGYGKDYELSITCPKCNSQQDHVVDLTELDTKELSSESSLSFTLPASGKTVKLRLMTRKLEKEIEKELDGIRKLKLQIEPEASTRLRYIIAEVDGSADPKAIRDVVDNMLVKDTRAIRDVYKTIAPDVEFESSFVCASCSYKETLPISLGINFFWPDARI